MSDLVEKSFNYKELLNTKLVLGQTRWVCRYGTLSEGHDKYTPAQRYFQAIKEAYYIACSIKRQDARLLGIEADLLEAKRDIELATDEVAKLRCLSKLKLAELSKVEALITKEDSYRQLDEYDKIIAELGPEVNAKYPEGIEQAEPDNWAAVMKARLLKHETVQNVPLPPETKAKLGSPHKRLDAVVPLMFHEEQLANRYVEQLIGDKNV